MQPVRKHHLKRYLPAMAGYVGLVLSCGFLPLLVPQTLDMVVVRFSRGFLSFGLPLTAGVVHGLPAALVALTVLPSSFAIYGMEERALLLRLRRQ